MPNPDFDPCPVCKGKGYLGDASNPSASCYWCTACHGTGKQGWAVVDEQGRETGEVAYPKEQGNLRRVK